MISMIEYLEGWTLLFRVEIVKDNPHSEEIFFLSLYQVNFSGKNRTVLMKVLNTKKLKIK